MTTNREWLYGLDVADLAAWFDAEHAEPNGGLAPKDGVSDHDGGSNVAFIAQDSREKLEAEASELVADYAASGEVCDPMYNGIIELFNRQAAMVERYWRKQVDALVVKGDKLAEANAELQAKLDVLKAHGVTVSEPFCGGYEVYDQFACDWRRKADMLEAERDELREKLSQAIGHASDIIALQDLKVER